MKIKSICIALLAYLSCSPSQADIEGRVVAVTDGDTIKVLDDANVQHKVRLTGIDAPEKSQPFGKQSTQSLASMVAGKDVLVESDKNDRYGRVLGKVWVQRQECSTCEQMLDVNRAQLVAGMAWWYRYYAKQQSPRDRDLYESAEDKAKAVRVGLWSDTNPVPPWDYRRGKKDRGNDITMPENCGPKRYCKEMDSCAEASFYLSECGLTSLDGNGDGVPCNSLCS